MAKRAVFHVLLICTVVILCACATSGASHSQRFFEAEACYASLLNDDGKRQYRSYWLACIRQFEAVHGMDPAGPWAAAGLYMSGRLYGELHALSRKPSDLTNSRNLLEQVRGNYPDSAYSKRAAADLKTTEAGGGAEKKLTDNARDQFFHAESAYNELKQSPDKQKYRSFWMSVIRDFERVRQIDSTGPWAAAGLFRTGEVYRELYRHSHNIADENKADELFRQVTREYPRSAYNGRAAVYLGMENGKEDPIARLTGSKTTSGEVFARKERHLVKPVTGDPTTITGIRYWSNPDYTRVVIDANQEAGFVNNLLKSDPSINLHHERLYIDLERSRLSNAIQRTISIDDAHLKSVRAGQHCPETVRVVMDMKSFEDYSVFALKNPFRIVVDVRGKPDAPLPTVPDMKAGTSPVGKAGRTPDAASIARQLALGVRRVVIDPGHGGRDPGALGAVPGVYEKDIVLEISKVLARKIERDLGLEAILTRTADTYLTLEERTAIANTRKADLFISIHANASTNRNAHGIETYFLNLTTDNESIAVAARENATSEKNISELQGILHDLMQNAKINESSRLATYVQQSMHGSLSGRFKPVVNKGVKQAPFYVLLGAQMPSILIETGFISNPNECRRMLDPEYQKAVASGIVDGIRAFIRDTRPPTLVTTN